MDYHHRRSIRLKGYDYSKAGAYFVTICCKDHQFYFVRIENQIMTLSPIGKIIKKFWHRIPNHFNNVQLDEYVIMPNHIHGIIIINEYCGVNGSRGEVTSPLPLTPSPWQQKLKSTPQHSPLIPSPRSITPPTPPSTPPIQHLHKPTLGQIIAYFKYQSTKYVNQSRNTPGMKLWQRNYYERIIRNDVELNQTRKYIDENPLKWQDTKNDYRI